MYMKHEGDADVCSETEYACARTAYVKGSLSFLFLNLLDDFARVLLQHILVLPIKGGGCITIQVLAIPVLMLRWHNHEPRCPPKPITSARMAMRGYRIGMSGNVTKFTEVSQSPVSSAFTAVSGACAHLGNAVIDRTR